MGHRKFSEDEIVQLDKNLDNLNDKWNEYVQQRLDGNEGDTHNPPALNRAVSDLLEHIIAKMADDGEIVVGMDLFAGFAANMFAFGQYAYEHGLKLTDLLSCTCSKITDEDIKNLLSN